MSSERPLFSIPEIANLVVIPWFVTCIVFFISLALVTPGVGNWLLAGIVALFSSALIFVFCLIGTAILIRLNGRYVSIIGGLTLGMAFGYGGYLFANLIAYFQGTIVSFLATGAIAGILMSIKVTANNRMQSDAAEPRR